MRRRRLRLALLAALLAGGLGLASSALAQTPTPGASPGATAGTGPAATASPGGPGASPAPSASPSASPAACPNPSPQPAPTPGPGGATPAPTPAPNLCPAEPKGSDPFSLIAWLFTPIFQVLFLGLAVAYNVLGDIGLAIVVLTIVIRLVLIPVFRAQIVSQRRMQLLQPELRAIQQKYRGDRARAQEEQMRFYRERGVNPVAGCLPALLQLVLLIPMYSVFSSGLSAPDIGSMLRVFGVPVVQVSCQAPGDPLRPCIDPSVWWLGNLDASRPEIFFVVPGIGFGLSLLAILSAILQLIQTRMLAPSTNDPQVAAQQRVFLLLPLFSIFYGSFLPAGLFIYWIVTTVFSIVQQYMIAGWGSLFPLFGWTPRFAADHTPRSPAPPPPVPAAPRAGKGEPPRPPARAPADRAAGTVRPARNRGRANRRGRRR